MKKHFTVLVGVTLFACSSSSHPTPGGGALDRDSALGTSSGGTTGEDGGSGNGGAAAGGAGAAGAAAGGTSTGGRLDSGVDASKNENPQDASADTDGASSAGGTSTGGTGGFDVAHAPSILGAFTTQGSVGCGTSGVTTGAQIETLSVDGAQRIATIFVPANYDAKKAYPVVFVFHGDGGTGASVRSALDLEPDASGKAIFAYPDGASKTWDADLIGTNSDMDLVFALRDSLREKYCVDTRRTFLTGTSRGGFFVNQLACRYGIAEFAAIAPHSSTLDPKSGNAYIYGPPVAQGGPFTEGGNYDFACPSDGSPPPAARPVLPAPALIIHGECDAESGVEYAQGRMVAEHWGFAAKCATTPAVAVTTSPNPTCVSGQLSNNPSLTVDPCYVAPGCSAGHDVTFCAIPSMGHQVWANAHARIWSFFSTH